MAIDLNALKTRLKLIFDTANSAMATQDLSAGLNRRVQKVLKVNPARIPIQPSFYPAVTVFTTQKEIELKGIAMTQLNAKREAVVEVKVAGIIMNSRKSDPTVDDADEDCEKLMENIEQILRADPTLSGIVTWQYPNLVTYHAVAWDEETMLRAGLMNLKAKFFY